MKSLIISFILVLFNYQLQAQNLLFSASPRPLQKSQNQYSLSVESEQKRLSLYKNPAQARFQSQRFQGAPAPKNVNDLKGFNELVPFVTPSPDQEDAGTCLFMSLTGIVEWWLAKLNQLSFTQDGPIDLSERWWVNVNDRLKKKQSLASNWITDTIQIYNESPAVLNSEYRYTKGWYRSLGNNVYKAKPGGLGASYGTLYNWVDEIDTIKPKFLKIPTFERTVVYRDPDMNPWQFGGLNFSAVEKVKQLLMTYKAPIQIVYNHLGYWHSVFIVGFDDNLPTLDCYFIRETKDYFASEKVRMRNELARASDGTLKKELDTKLQELLSNEKKLNLVHQRNGGCHPKGMFYVRDSQYPDTTEELYKYDLNNLSASTPYAKRIILREYNWLSDLANHIVLITTK